MCCLCFHYSVSVLIVTAIGTGFIQHVKSRRSNKSYRIFLYIFLPFFASYNVINKLWKFAVLNFDYLEQRIHFIPKIDPVSGMLTEPKTVPFKVIHKIFDI